ncbi:undecaprenyldiphospho-muramoylpentapeptide beta-N-acetylglucosaminyltransferase [Nitratidesulfovibrio liaohensis]|uniref:UDP-N-acetylglucosamine--N-acetylmuramyl-(pentapeptide) pyrophosphoryl-undecaprenol N-acetylglucosamine transferase n=1 Tax=Nitratidesulfovibrio liaohensis TaxID=2604158 RepID=A0ABY9R488_9BACT|nr:undecaprenyldiphospho-muramoylpentapeptide beta-N-acetylglucosaminyltransferase [Nitratidesulfovibrio liaohensis]WMW66563.1 undecaprenyldiphospho-muramoylpentapeptide beta-N-acetylglucosaminyltransferase [Nitratidesulfovibrio liaohensis]
MRRVILTTGGTGGHIFPALAVAEEITRRYPKARILFLGGQYGPEADLAARAGLEYVGLPVRGVMGRGLRALAAAGAMGLGVWRAVSVVRRFDPDIAVGFGGYAAFAGVLAARLCGRPAAIHEQNAIPGLTNRLLGHVVQRVFLSLPDTAGVFPARRCVPTGNPVRAAIVAAGATNTADAADKGDALRSAHSRRLLVMGGSLGARAINDAVVAALPALRDAGVQLWHQTGTSDWERVRTGYKQAGISEARVEAFIDDVASAYTWADLVLCRAGATSVAELAVAGKPSVLVPFPFATHNHQLHNARHVADAGAALVVEQKDVTPGADGKPAVALDRVLVELLADRERLADMGRAARAMGRPQAAAAVVDGMEAILAGRG